MSMFEKYYTPEQLQQLEERRQQLGDETIKQVESEGPHRASRGVADPEDLAYLERARATRS
jgi:MerR family transcriptional regulator, thiopeptide resistance regulator